MTTLFPSLLAYPGVAALILRVVCGVTLAYFSYKKIRGEGQSSGSNSKIYGVAELLIAVLLIIGLYTQTAALLNAIILVIKIAIKAKEGKLLTDGINYYILILAMVVSLLFLSPGYLSIGASIH